MGHAFTDNNTNSTYAIVENIFIKYPKSLIPIISYESRCFEEKSGGAETPTKKLLLVTSPEF